MVSCDPLASQWGTLACPTERGSSVTVGGMHLASLPRLPAAACLATMSMLLSRPYLMLERVDPECCSVPI